MPYTVELPDGRSVEFPDDVPKEKAAEIIRSQLGIGEGKKGLGAAVAKGTESMVSQMRSGLGGIFSSPEEAATAGLERGKGINTEYADQIGFDKVKEAYGRGLLPAAGEVIRQVPLALAEQLPNLATMAGGAKAGAMALARATPYGRIIGGIAGALAPSAVQQFGGNIERQAAEQQEAEQPVAIDRGAALAATAVQAPLDVLGNYIPLGGRLVGKLVGIPEKALLADTTGKVAKLAEEKLLATLAKGTGVGILAEVPTEVTQQMLERAQAGLSLTDADALKEYGETIYQTALLGPLGAVGRVSERAGARSQIDQQKQEEQRQAQILQANLEQQQQAATAAAQKQAEIEEAQYRQSPQFVADAEQAYATLQQEVATLNAALRTKVGPDDLAGVAARKEARDRLREINKDPKTAKIVQDYRDAQKMKPPAAGAPPAATPPAAAGTPAAAGPVLALPAPTPEEPAPEPKPEPLEGLMQQYDELEQQSNSLADRLQQAGAAKDTEAHSTLLEQYKGIEDRRKAIGAKIEQQGGVAGYALDKPPEEFKGLPVHQEELAEIEKKIKAATKAAENAGTNGEFALQNKALAKLDALNTQKQALQQDIEKRRDAIKKQQAVASTGTGETMPLFTKGEAPPSPAGVDTPNVTERARGLANKPSEAKPVPRRARAAKEETGPTTPNMFDQLAEQDRAEEERNLRERGQTRPLFTEEQAPLPKAETEDKAPQRYNTVKESGELIEGRSPRRDREGILDNAPEETRSEAGRMHDIFSPFNIYSTDLRNGELLGDFARNVGRAKDREARTQSLDAKAADQRRFMEAMEQRLNLPGRKRVRAVFPIQDFQPSKFQPFDPYVKTMDDIQALRDRIEQKGKANKSILQQAVDAYAAREKYNELLDKGVMPLLTPASMPLKFESWLKGIQKLNNKISYSKSVVPGEFTEVKPMPPLGMKDKVDALAAKAKGEKELTRPLTKNEIKQIRDKRDSADRVYNKLVTEKITPATNQIFALYESLYEVSDVEAYDKTTARKTADVETLGRTRNKVSKEADVAARFREGDVRKEVANSQTMQDFADKAGRESEVYLAASAQFAKRLGATINEYGELEVGANKRNGDKVEAANIELDEIAMREGRKTPAYKAELKKSVERLQDAISYSNQTQQTKRTEQVVRKTTVEPTTMRTGSEDSKEGATTTTVKRGATSAEISPKRKPAPAAAETPAAEPAEQAEVPRSATDKRAPPTEEDGPRKPKVSQTPASQEKKRDETPEEAKARLEAVADKARTLLIKESDRLDAFRNELTDLEDELDASQVRLAEEEAQGRGTPTRELVREYQSRIANQKNSIKAQNLATTRAHLEYSAAVREAQAVKVPPKAAGEKFLRGVESNSPDLTPEQVTALENNKLTDALKSIAADSRTSKLNKAVALRLAELLDNTNIKIAANVADQSGASALGKVNVSGTQITLNRKGGLSQETLLHEGTHAAIERVLSMPDSQLTDIQRVAKRELMALHAAIKNDPRITSTFAKGSLSEFTAEVMSNRTLQLQLSDKKWKLSDAWKGFKSIVLRMLGIERPETMLGAAIQSIDALFTPTSMQQKGQAKGTKLSAKDIAALHTGSNSMKQFAEQFGTDFIKQADRSPEDAERIGQDYLDQMSYKPGDFVAPAEETKLSYKAIMPDGTPYDPDNALHYISASVETFAILQAGGNENVRRREARQITRKRVDALRQLVDDFSFSSPYTKIEQALVAKAASKYAIIADKNGRLKIAEIATNNRHPVAVVGNNAVAAIIQELRAGKSLKAAFLDGLQSEADKNVKRNGSKNGWQKFEQSDDLDDAVKLNAACAGTSWCTASGVETASDQLTDGDFYVNFKDGVPTVAVRMDGKDKIGEVRGHTQNQGLTDEQQQIAKDFISANKFEGSREYLKEMVKKETLIRVFQTGYMTPKDIYAVGAEYSSTSDAIEPSWGWYRFSNLDGYNQIRPNPSAKVLKRFTDILEMSVELAIEDGHYVIGYIAGTYGNDITAPLTFHLGARRKGVSLKEIKSARHLLAESGQYPNLEFARTLSIDYSTTKAKFPKLRTIDKLILEQSYFYTKPDKGDGTFYFAGDTKVRALGITTPRTDKYGTYTVDLNGIETVSEDIGIIESREGGKAPLILNFPDIKFTPIPNLVSEKKAEESILKAAAEVFKAANLNRDLFTNNDAWGELDGDGVEEAESILFKSENDFLRALPTEARVVARRAFDDFDELNPPGDDGNESYAERVFSVVRHTIKTAKADPVQVYMALLRSFDRTATLLGEDVKVNLPQRIADAPPISEVNDNNEEFLYSKPMYANDTLAAAGAVGDQFIAKNKSTYEKVKANGTGLAFETSYIDRFAGFERLAKLMPSLKGTQMMYYLRMYDQRMNFVSQSVSRGALQLVKKTRPDGGKEFLIESKEGPSLAGVVGILKDATKMVGNGEGVNRLFTLYLSAIRAKSKGLDALHFGTALTQADLDKAMKAIQDTPGLEAIFKRARDEYNAYNRGLINFAVQTDALSKDVAATLLKENDYIPWYRQRNGVAELVIGKETPINVGNITHQPYLKELIGGDTPILDFMTSSVQNTNLLTDMALRNRATLTSVMELVEMKLAKIGSKNMAGPNIVKFRVDGEDRAAMIDTDTAGVDADILVKGMEGIPVQLSGIARILAFPATVLRKAITLSPLYVARQLFRDSLAAPILSGADFLPIMGALKELNSSTKSTLESRGITGGQIFTGGSEDLTKILQDITDGKSTWMQGINKLQAMNMEADALTRRAQYNSYIKQGLSEMEATLMALESMNFNKRGASPSIHLANSLIPFFNAQIQSMNVLYKAFNGKMPFNERLRIKEKLIERGLILAGISVTYAIAMQDDEAYKNATPDQKYGNWFFRIPGIDEPLRFPIPFEIGYIFKALPEALVNTMMTKHGGEEAVEAFTTIFKQLIPGGTSLGIPQAMKPAIEAKLGKSFYTGRDILNRQEQGLLPEQQVRPETTEASKYIASGLGMSPIILDGLVQGYTGTMGLALLQAVSAGLPLKGEKGPEQAYKRLSEMPVIGGAFQPNDAGGIITNVYERMLEIQKLDNSVDALISRGRVADAKELVAQRSNEYMMSEVAGEYISTIRELTQYENAIKASDLSPEEKRKRLDEIRKMKIRYSAQSRQAVDKTTLQ
jgi:hypothetical protein